MKFLRIVAGIVSIIPAAFAVLALVNNAPVFVPASWDAVWILLPATLAALCWWFVLQGGQALGRKRIKRSLMVGVVLGLAGFVGGYVGPIILTPNSNTGPLLGIFFTGPAGLTVGLWVGAVYAFVRLREVPVTATPPIRA